MYIHTHTQMLPWKESNQKTTANPIKELQLFNSVKNTHDLKDTVEAIVQNADKILKS